MTPPGHSILATQAKYNRSTAESWQSYATHRAEIARLLEPLPGARGGSLLVLGAGNCNDLHLATLLENFDQVHLVDIDALALADAVRRQKVKDAANLHLHGDVDLTGVAAAMSAWKNAPPSRAAIEQTVRAARDARLSDFGGPFDVVLSPCVLSQIVGYPADLLGKQHPGRLDLLRAIRDRHLRLLVELSRPGGQALLVCDMISSNSLPDLMDQAPSKVPRLLERAVHREEHFEGLSPGEIQHILNSDPKISPLVKATVPLKPWAWRLSPSRSFLVYALRIRRREQVSLFT